MKTNILTSIILIVMLLLTNCSSDDNSDRSISLIGNWKLIEILSDPGDGSGTFTPVESEKTITFHDNGTITSNGMLCDISTNANNPTSGTYSISQSTFVSVDCFDPTYNYEFEQNGSMLTVSFPCIEACSAKYQKE